MTLPPCFGKDHFKNNKEAILTLMGTEHRCLVYLMCGGRRDGKTVAMGVLIAATLTIIGLDPIKSFFFYASGVSQLTANRVLIQAADFLNHPSIQNKYYKKRNGLLKIKITHQTITIWSNDPLYTAHVRLIAAAPTDAQFRGVNSDGDFVDEWFFIPDNRVIGTLFVERWKENSVGAMLITTPRTTNTWTLAWYPRKGQLSTVLYVENISKICKACIKDKMDKMGIEDAIAYCNDAGHVEVIDVPWMSLKARREWAEFEDKTTVAEEAGGMVDTEFTYIFRADVRDLLEQEDQRENFQCFVFSIDPALGGSSEMSMMGCGVDRDFFSVLFEYAHHTSQTKTTLDYAKIGLTHYVEKLLDLGLLIEDEYAVLPRERRQPIFVFIESFGQFGLHLHEFIVSRGWSSFIHVVKAIKPQKKTGTYLEYGFPAGGNRTQKIDMVNDLSGLIRRRLFKVHKCCFSMPGANTQFELRQMVEQLMNYGINNRQKRGPKDPNKRDDRVSSAYFIPYWFKRGMTPADPLYAQVGALVEMDLHQPTWMKGMKMWMKR